MTAPVLAFPYLNKAFIIYSDVSYYYTGAILSQGHEIESKIQERPVTYVAYQFSPAQLKYAVIKKKHMLSTMQ